MELRCYSVPPLVYIYNACLSLLKLQCVRKRRMLVNTGFRSTWGNGFSGPCQSCLFSGRCLFSEASVVDHQNTFGIITFGSTSRCQIGLMYSHDASPERNWCRRQNFDCVVDMCESLSAVLVSALVEIGDRETTLSDGTCHTKISSGKAFFGPKPSWRVSLCRFLAAIFHSLPNHNLLQEEPECVRHLLNPSSCFHSFKVSLQHRWWCVLSTCFNLWILNDLSSTWSCKSKPVRQCV